MVAVVPLVTFASGALLLATTPYTLVQPAGASSFYSSTNVFYSSPYTFDSSSFAEACSDEIFSCGFSDRCNSCSSLDEDNIGQLEECFEDITVDDPDSSMEYCSALMDAVCCLDKISDIDCVENQNFVGLWLCDLELQGCLFDHLTCDDNGGVAGSRSNAVISARHASFAAFACALFVHFLALL